MKRGREFAFDDAAMVADDLGHQRQPEPGAGRLGGDERIEQMRHEVGRHAGAVVLDRDLERQADAGLTARHRQAHAGAERGGKRDLAVGAPLADRLGGVLDEIEEYLDQLVPAARHRWQRRIVILDDLDLAGEAGARDLLHMIEHVVDIDRFALQRPLVAEDLHAVDQFADAVGLGADQLRQGTVAIGALALEQLRRAPDAGQRVLDLVGEHGGEAGYRAGGAAMGKLALDHLRHAALLQHDHHAAGHFRDGPAVKIDQFRRVEAERAEIDAVLVDRGAVALHLLDQGDERAAEGDHVGERAAAQDARAHAEEIFRRNIGVYDGEPFADDEERVRQRAQQRLNLNRLGRGNAPRVGLFGRAAQAVYPLLGRNGWSVRGCTIFMQEDPMNFNWAQYEGFSARATLVLPQCSISLILGFTGFWRENR